MPPVERINRYVVGREYATYSCRFTFENSSPFTDDFGLVLTQTILTDQSADFWVDQIGAGILNKVDPGTGIYGQYHTADLIAAVQINDIRTNKNLGYTSSGSVNWDGFPVVLAWPQDAIPIAVLRKANYGEDSNAVLANLPLPSGFRDTGTLPQPFCITRQGGIVVTFTNFGRTKAAGAIRYGYDITLMFSGWKEYANASR